MSSKPMKYKGKTYPTLTALVAAHGKVGVKVVNSRLHNGWGLHAALTVPIGRSLRSCRKPVTFEGVEYPSVQLSIARSRRIYGRSVIVLLTSRLRHF